MTTGRSLRAVVLVAAASVLAAGCGFSISQADVDGEAAIFADQLLAPRLESELAELGGESGPDRVEAVHAWLTAPDEDFVRSLSDSLWVTGAPRGSTIPVTAYVLWSDTAFVNEQRWGRVCREYDVAVTITTRAVDCPEDTPEEPPSDAVGSLP